MPVTQKTYPEWVQKYRTRGKTVKKKGNTYYLYSRTSRRVPGKKYPQPVDTYIGIITPEGIIETKKKKVDLTDIEIWEYGFSKAVSTLCPEGWKDPLGEDWEDVLNILICDWSQNSYLKTEELRKKEDFRYQFNAQAASLSRRIFKEHGIEIKSLEILKNVYLLKIDGKMVISKINPGQKELFDRFGVELEV